MNYYFIPSTLLKLTVYTYKPHITYVIFVFPRQYNSYTPFVISKRRRHLDNTTFLCVFPNRAIIPKKGAR